MAAMGPRRSSAVFGADAQEDEDIWATQNTRNWDMRVPLPDADSDPSEESKRMESFMKMVKILVYIFTFCIVLISSTVAKGSMLFMTSQLSQEKVTEFCNLDLERNSHYTSKVPYVELVGWTWCIVIAYSFPEICYFIRSIRIYIFKSQQIPTLKVFLVVATLETLNAVGHSLLLFCILPNLDVICGAVLSYCVCLIPGLLGLHSPYDNNEEVDLSNNTFGESKKDKGIYKTTSEESKKVSAKSVFLLSLDTLAIGSQISGLIIWPVIDEGQKWQLLTLPFSLIFISVGWWESYASKYSNYSIIRSMSKIKEDINNSRYFIYTILSIWKILIFLCVTLISWHLSGKGISEFFNRTPEIFSSHKITVSESLPVNTYENGYIANISNAISVEKSIEIDASHQILLYFLAIQLISAYVCYVLGKFACKVCIQEFSFAFPLNLTVPVTIILLSFSCIKHSQNACYFNGILPNHLFFNSPLAYSINYFIIQQHAWLWPLWFFSQIWITRHIWKPKFHRVAPTEKLFVNSSYSAALVDQSIVLSRRQDDEPDLLAKSLDDYCELKELKEGIMDSEDQSLRADFEKNKLTDCITRIYACATMWHETKEEIMDLLKSIFYLDSDQSARETAQKYFKVVDPDYYKLEVNIFFDDAFELGYDEYKKNSINMFVKSFIETVDVAASVVHNQVIKLKPPLIYITPYGGRLTWTLPGKNKMIVHLKDKTKIKNRKRWSLVMLIYYILGHSLLDLPIDVYRQQRRAENTFILALDGDVNFKPKAVQLLIDRMKKNLRVGAVCGRVHPAGSGPMVWYQKFEYAIAHWLQKATENVIGSVLCSPGCFSLYRGTALMEVVNQYAIRPYEAKHFLQFEQGEDRWLSTLLLQRGFFIEYCAASDAYTHTPESFNEFYNQRRRWITSTIVNIMDLLKGYKRITKLNHNISALFIGYQMILMVGTILSPGTIFLMLIAAFNAAFKLDIWTSFILNFIPIFMYMSVCLICKYNVQLAVALLLSTIYGLVMMAIFVVILIQIVEDGPLAPTSLFIIMLVGAFFITALLHPNECGCIIQGITFYITIPAMYLLLIIYSIFNLNNISWGTREFIINRTQKELMEQKRNRRRKSVFGFLNSADRDDDAGSFELSLAGLCRCLFCTHKDENKVFEKEQLLKVSETLVSIDSRLKKIECRSNSEAGLNGKTTSKLNHIHEIPTEMEHQNNEQSSNITDNVSHSGTEFEGDDQINQKWTEDVLLEEAEISFLSPKEDTFWNEVLDKYLHPTSNYANQIMIIKELKELRNKCVFAFFMLNAFFVVTVLILQLNEDLISIKWPLGARTSIRFTKDIIMFHISKNYLKLEPIGFVMAFSFGVPLILQLIAMCIHRLRTFCHIISSIELNWHICKKGRHTKKMEALTPELAVEIVREWQKLRGIDEYPVKKESMNAIEASTTADCLGYNSTSIVEFLKRVNMNERLHSQTIHTDHFGRRPTVMVIESNRNKKCINTHDIAFKRRIESINPALLGDTIFGQRLSERHSSVSLGLVRGIIHEESGL